MTNLMDKRSVIISEACAALASNDFLMVSRIYARLARRPLDEVIADAIAEAIRNASEEDLSRAARFANRSAEIREETEARLA